MIIWGSYVIRKELKSGQFYCPQCQTDRQYIHKLPRRWGHLYWIPLVVLGTHESYVECQTCSNAYQEQAIDHDPRRDHAIKMAAIAAMAGQVMIHVAHSRGAELTIGQIEKFTCGLLGIKNLPEGAEAQLSTSIDRSGMLNLVRERGDELTARGKELVLRAALGDEAIAPSTQTLVFEIGVAMGLTPAHVSGILAELIPPPIAKELAPQSRRPAEETVFAPYKAHAASVWD